MTATMMAAGLPSDGFVALLNVSSTNDWSYFGGLVLSSTGAVRINAVALDGCQNLYVAGSFVGGAFEMDPQGAGFQPPSYHGVTDLFVAKYVLVPDSISTLDKIELEWAYTAGRGGADAAMAIAVARDGTVYAAGYLWDEPSSMGAMTPDYPRRDIWLARFDQPQAPQPPQFLSPTWEVIISGPEDEAAFGLALDAYERPTITGLFGMERFGAPTANYTLDFNPDPLQTFHLTTAGGYDAFVARYNHDGTFQEAFSIGGEYNDEGTGIAFAPVGTIRRMYHGGSFGGPNAPTDHQVNFDPGGTATAQTRGSSDAFINVLAPAIPSSVVMQVSLSLDASVSLFFSNWSSVRSAYQQFIQDPTAFPHNDESVMVNVVLYHDLGGAEEVIPWTVVTSYSAPLLAHLMEYLEPEFSFETHPSEGIRVSRETLEESNVTGVCYRTIHLMAAAGESFGPGSLEYERDLAMISAWVDQINAIALPTGGQVPVDRDYLVDHAIGPTAPPIAFANQADGNWTTIPQLLLDALWIKLRRATRCPGDFNWDGVVDSRDWDEFEDAWKALDPSADWNLDGFVDQADWNAFAASYAAPCPCP